MTSQAKEDYWLNHIIKWQQSGQSKRQYCLTNEISYWTFRDWQKKVNPTKSEKLVKVPRQTTKIRIDNSQPIEILVNNKISIRINRGFDGNLLRDILSELGAEI